MPEPQEYLVLQQLTDVLDDLKISYAIGGSIASSVYGKVRFTQDMVSIRRLRIGASMVGCVGSLVRPRRITGYEILEKLLAKAWPGRDSSKSD